MDDKQRQDVRYYAENNYQGTLLEVVEDIENQAYDRGRAATASRLLELNKKLREALEQTKLAKSRSQEGFDEFVDKKLEELKED